MNLAPGLHWLRSQPMLTTLIQWAQIHSGSEYLSGLQQMHRALTDAFQNLATVSAIDLPPRLIIDERGQTQSITSGQALCVRQRPEAAKRVLLVGHMDTVFGPEHAFTQVTQRDDRLHGPGVADMKGGLVVLWYALQAWERCEGAHALGWDVIISPDEELGSPASMPLLLEYATHHQMALVFEPTLDEHGTMVSTRRGSGKFTLIVQGRSAHVGRAFAQGVSANVALAHLVQQCHQWNMERDSVTVNIGRISGGDAVNRVPDWACARLDIRLNDGADQAWITERLQQLVDTMNQQPGLTVALHGGFTRPPKICSQETAHALSLLQRVQQDMGLVWRLQPTGGCCDGNNLASHCGVIDTMGVRGGGIHSDAEYMCVDSLTERSEMMVRWLQAWRDA